VALGVHLTVGDHRAVEAQVDAVDLGVRPDGIEELSRELARSLGAQDAVRGIGPAAPTRDGRHAGRRIEDLEGATDLSRARPLRLEQLIAVVLGEVASVARDRVEGGDLLDEHADEDAVRFSHPEIVSRGRCRDRCPTRLLTPYIGRLSCRDSQRP